MTATAGAAGSPDDRQGLGALLEPRSVAVVGASDDPDKVGGRPIDFLRRFGFAGSVYPVNPNRATVQGFTSYANLAALPEPPDVAIVAVGGAGAVGAVAECAAAGVRAAIVLASGFAEASAEGRTRQDEMVAVARSAGMRIVGPNCQGITSFHRGAVLSFSTMFIEVPPQDGPVAIVSQSGSMSQVPYAVLRSRGIGVRYCHATGNEADVSAVELATAVATDTDIGLLVLYLETIRDGAALAELGRIAVARSLPVVALKAGATPAGQAAAATHTGALANEDRVVDAFLERVGIVRARDLPDLLLAAELYLRGWRPSGRRLAVVSNSGASCVQAADAITDEGLALARLEPAVRDEIAAILPEFATATNPIDLTAGLLGNPRLFSEVLPILGRDRGVDAVVVALPVAGQGYDVESFAADTAAFVASAQKPTVVVAINPPVVDRFRADGVPVFPSEAEAVRALAQWTAWHERATAAAGDPFRVVPRTVAAEPTTLDEAASLALLADAGVPVVAHRLCGDADAAVEALSELGSPVVVKGCTALVTHKSELGLVEIGLRTAADVRAAFVVVAERLHAVDPAAPGVLVAAMGRGVRELLIGARVDPVFGPIVVVGDGGKYVDVLPDVRVLPAPCDRAAVIAALRALRIAPVLAGVRGEPAAAVEDFADAAVAVGRLIADDRHGIVDLDINPVIVGAEGTGCLAVDATVRRAPRR